MPFTKKTDGIFDSLIVLVFIATAIRGITSSVVSENGLSWAVLILTTLFGCLLAMFWIFPCFIRQNLVTYFLIQSVIAFSLLLIPDHKDFYAILFGILSIQAMQMYTYLVALRWIGLFSLSVGIGLVFGFGFIQAMPFILLYIGLYLTIAYLIMLKNRSESAREESEYLLKELQKTHFILQQQAGQIEELAIIKERDRLARDLHDSVTQSLYSLMLYAEAASRELTFGRNDVVNDHLKQLSQTAHQALQEMRLMIFDLRPPELEQNGLVIALRDRLESVELRSGVEIDFYSNFDERLPMSLEAGMYSIAREALNNVLKHSRATYVQVSVCKINNNIVLEISDNGLGIININGKLSSSGMRGMRERAKQLNAKISFDSMSKGGTVVKVEAPLE